jgi:hypothetical protein
MRATKNSQGYQVSFCIQETGSSQPFSIALRGVEFFGEAHTSEQTNL